MTFETAQEEALHKLDECMPTSVVSSLTSSKRARKVSLGDMRVAAIRRLLETGFGVTRSTMQTEFHEAFLAATSRHLYSSDSNVNWAEVKARQGWADTRAVGKSSYFCAFFPIRNQHLTRLQSYVRPLADLARLGAWASSLQPMWCACQTASSQYSQRVKELPAKCWNSSRVL